MIGALLIEDDPDIRDVVTDLLQLHFGFDQVDSVVTGEEGLKLFDPEIHHVVITDYWLPGVNGVQVATELRARMPTLPIAIMSGAPPIVDHQLAVVFSKPLNLLLFERWLSGAREEEVHLKRGIG